MNKYFIITIDTEGDNLWNVVKKSTGNRCITTENARYVERFQHLCESYGFIPTYLVNYEMAESDEFVYMAREWAKQGTCEIGMHMHAWNTPPIYDFPYLRVSNNPYAGEYPREILWEKMKILTGLIEERFGVKPYSHRGGRWYIDGWYVNALIKLGYKVDCSITPGISWADQIGYQKMGCDYRGFHRTPYIINEKDIRKNARSGLLEVQPTIKPHSFAYYIREVMKHPENIREILSRRMWLRPNGKNLSDLLYLADSENEYIEFMLHSSELMPGGNPTFRNPKQIDNLYEDLKILFDKIAEERCGIGLTDYAGLIESRRKL